MYRKKEWVGIVIFISMILIWNVIVYFPKKKVHLEKDESYLLREAIIIKVEGEVVRPIELEYTNQVSYGVLFLRIQNGLNEFSDLSNFDLNKIISTSTTIYIPTYDVGNHHEPSIKVCINLATLDELKKLPQIGEKRGQKIMDYIALNGRIDTWETFFKIAGVPENVKEDIKKQAIL